MTLLKKLQITEIFDLNYYDFSKADSGLYNFPCKKTNGINTDFPL